jgi:hypothetical protein
LLQRLRRHPRAKESDINVVVAQCQVNLDGRDRRLGVNIYRQLPVERDVSRTGPAWYTIHINRQMARAVLVLI